MAATSIFALPPCLQNYNPRDIEALQAEFNSIPDKFCESVEEARNFSEFSTGNNPINKIRNRYANIIANDSTRVKLQDRTNDYINANYLDNMILTQGPLSYDEGAHYDSQADFYHMLFTNKSSAIFMLTDYEEKGKIKCSRYLPSGKPKSEVNYTITGINETQPALTALNIAVTKLYIKKVNFTVPSASQFITISDKPHEVTHYHYPWPDKEGTNPKAVAQIVRILLKEPMSVIHCSAGIGRTGTVVAVALAYRALNKGSPDPKLIPKTVAKIREQRRGLVQTPEQYSTIYKTLICMLEEDQKSSK